MRRQLFFLERVLYGDGTLPFNGVFALKLKGRPDGGLLGDALKKMQARHPLLRSHIEVDEKQMPWFVAGDEWPAIPVRFGKRLSDTQWTGEVLDELATAFDTAAGPLFRVVWLEDEESVDLIICFHHCMCDGGSGLCLLSELLGLLDEPGGDLGAPELFMDMEALLPEPSMRGKGKRFALLLRLGLAVGGRFISSKGKSLISRDEDYLLHWQLSPGVSRLVVSFCREQGVTVNTLICVAVARAFCEIRGERAFGKVTCPVDIRKYHPGIRKDNLWAFGLAVTLTLRKRDAVDFFRQVKEAQVLLSRELKKLDARGSLVAFEQSHPGVADMIRILTYGRPGNDGMFSNLGRIDLPDAYRHFEVEQVYSPVVVGPFGNPTTVTTLSWKGRLDFSFVSNRRVLSEEEARRIRDRAMSLIVDVVEAGVSMAGSGAVGEGKNNNEL